MRLPPLDLGQQLIKGGYRGDLRFFHPSPFLTRRPRASHFWKLYLHNNMTAISRQELLFRTYDFRIRFSPACCPNVTHCHLARGAPRMASAAHRDKVQEIAEYRET
jgi:hypothetical protein